MKFLGFIFFLALGYNIIMHAPIELKVLGIIGLVGFAAYQLNKETKHEQEK